MLDSLSYARLYIFTKAAENFVLRFHAFYRSSKAQITIFPLEIEKKKCNIAQ
jgi:hypothetical protein